MKKGKFWILGITAVILIGLCVWLWPVIRIAMGLGLLEKSDTRQHDATSVENLRLQHVALTLYLESEGQFPEASGWMDAIENRLKTGDMTKEESKKKLIYPGFVGQDGKYGYAMNSAASQKIPQDFPTPDKTPLVFESQSTERNAHGNPETDAPKPPRAGGNHFVTVSGKLSSK